MSDGNLRQGPWSPSNAAGGGGVDGGGSGAHVPDMAVRLARLEGEFSAFKTMLAAVIAIMLGGFAFLGAQLSRIDSRITGVESRVSGVQDQLDSRIQGLQDRLDSRIAGVQDRLDGRITGVDGRITGLAADVQALPGKINADLQNLTRTLADSINAAKQTPPQVLLLPAPGTQPPPSHP